MPFSSARRLKYSETDGSFEVRKDSVAEFDHRHVQAELDQRHGDFHNRGSSHRAQQYFFAPAAIA